MSKKLLISFLILLCGCSENSPIDEKTDYVTIDYPESFIKWNDLLSFDHENYFIYVFSYDCYYCNQLKRKVVCFYEFSRFPVYFCEYSKNIPIGHDIENTVGADKIENVFIQGTPTLILINKKTVAFNVAGKAEVSEMINLQLKNE